MKIRKKLFLVSVIILLLLSIVNQKNGLSENQNENLSKNLDPIVVVNGNGGFTGSGFTGFGTESQPYILENKVINGEFSHCIYISNTDAHFIIRNSIVYNGSHGVYLDNVTNGKFINVTSHGNPNSGILIYQNCENIQYINSTIYNNNANGFYLYGPFCENCLIQNNIIYNNTKGIYVYQGANFHNITDNTLYDHSQIGIFLHNVVNCTVTGNIAYDNDEGIATSNCDNTSIIDNFLHTNNDGIRLSGNSDNNNV
ncbi:MAG: hypothetical protein EU547_04450, partial [Promethearchaeota archaeon]